MIGPFPNGFYMIDITALLECAKKPPTELDPVSRAAVVLLDHAAHQMCEGHTGRKFSDLDTEERNYWRDQAWTGVLEWNNEHTWLEKRARKGGNDAEPDQGAGYGS